jgi:hypothetical protein
VEETRARTLLLNDARGNDRFLRVTWHPASSVLVFSHWTGTVCTASTPVKLPEASKIVDIVVRALRDAAERTVAEPLSVASGGPGLVDRLLKGVRPSMAAVVRLSERLTSRQPGERSG